ncbi:MAG: hypothetical protein F4029_19000 [Gammaproteobacteria bacterium]|nr:hypothetical protein [Gammaproteobacteria bacterium]MYF29112.1 hypothetical protein [Gammaproteobacteria bacterium]MYK48305.1 hypothetical protein [Gammaproteobacteria bacterium]
MRFKPLHRDASDETETRPARNPAVRRTRTAMSILWLVLPSAFLATGHVAAGEAGANAMDRDPDPVVDETVATEGELFWGDGHHYRGGLKGGNQMHGRGTHTAPDGEVYTGDFVDGERHGQGVLKFPNGDVYSGDFRVGAMTGRGRLTWANGDVYEGDFTDGVREGRGVLERETGGTYTGDFLADLRHGLGHYRWRDGTLYKGRFRYGRQDGSGIKQSPGGELDFETWNDGQLARAVNVEPVEHCALTIAGKPWMFTDDTCINGLAHGQGLAVALDGTAYILDGRFILGRIVRGEIRDLELGDAP